MNAKQQVITDRLTELLPTITALQESYLSHYGQYFQGLATHAKLPDGITPAIGDTSFKPSDQAHDYADFWRGVHPGVEPVEGESPVGLDEPLEEQFLYPETVLEEVKELTVCSRFNVSNGQKGWSWELVLDYDDGEHWRAICQKDGEPGDWAKIEPEEDLV